jgi:PAS domain S-box-containing protein
VARRLSTPDALSSVDPLLQLTAGEALPILLVDDRTENLRALEAVLEPLGYPLLSVTSGEEALRLLLTQDVALILLDVRMPGLDGLETAQLIKGRSRTRDVPIVFLTAARDDVHEILRGYGVGAVDYVMKPFDPELLRSKAAVFVELERGRRALERSESFLLATFEAAPIGKTVLDGTGHIVRANPAFARMLERDAATLAGIAISELCHPDDRELLARVLGHLAPGLPTGEEPRGDLDLRLRTSSGSDRWVEVVSSAIGPTEFEQPLLLVQWVDLSARRRAENARAELLLEHSARTHAEALAERLSKLQSLTSAIESLSIDAVLRELAPLLATLFGAELVEVRVADLQGHPFVVRAVGDRLLPADAVLPSAEARTWHEATLRIDQQPAGAIRIGMATSRPFTRADRSLLEDAAERAALALGRARLHERERRIAAELQRGLIPKQLPRLSGVELSAHYQAAGSGAVVGGDWYDAFVLPGDRIGIVLGDVAGRGIPAASAMGNLRSVTRAFAFADGGRQTPDEVLTRVNRHQLALGEEEMFTLVYAIIDPARRELTWSNAGHLPPLLLGDGAPQLLAGGDGLMGIEEVTYELFVRPIPDPALVVFYTDGLVERRGESLDEGMARLAEIAGAGPSEPHSLRRHIIAALLPDDGPIHDDVTVVVVAIGEDSPARS